MNIIKNGIIAILLIAATISVSVAVTTYATRQELQRDYTLLEERYVQLHSHMIQEQLAGYMLPVGC